MYYAQFGEDAILAKIFADTPMGSCIEVGANNGVDGSATLYFEERGWRCVLIEPIPELCRELRGRRTGAVFECAASSADGEVTFQVATGDQFAHAVSAIGGEDRAAYIRKRHGHATQSLTVRTRRLDDLLEEAGVPPGIDFMTIDVEGHELDALKGLSLERWKPRLLIVEDNTPWGDRPVSAHLRNHGYVKVRRTGVNDWYAREDDAKLARPLHRLGYFPDLIKGRLGVSATYIARALPFLKQLPGFGLLRRVLLGAS